MHRSRSPRADSFQQQPQERAAAPAAGGLPGAELVERTDAILARLRQRRPRVHCITNAVAQTFSANMLLALGAVPSMTIAADEVADFVAAADALLINLGTLDPPRREAIARAVERAGEKRIPWLLDPVFVERSPQRVAYARMLVSQHPAAVRLNAAEFKALAQADAEPDDVSAFARSAQTVVGLTGDVDFISDGTRLARVANGDALMGRVTAMGCAGSALVAAFLAIESDPFVAVAAGLLVLGVAGEVAARGVHGPGSFAAAILDSIYALDGATLRAQAKVS